MVKRSSRRSNTRVRTVISRAGNSWMSQLMAEPLEKRLQMSGSTPTNVLTFHNDAASDGVNNTETTLSPANVKVGSFGKTATVPVDGNVYAEPLVLTSDTVTTGPNTIAGATGVHDVVFVETENDSIYAVDTHSGAVLWQRSFLNIGAGAGLTAGTDINNPLNATAITAPNDNDVQSQDINPIFGITGTPVIDPNTGIIYLVAFTKEMVNGVGNFVQRLHAISVKNGTDVGTPFTIGNTTGANTNNTPVYVYGSGDGGVTDPYNNTGKQVVQFNSLRENQREGLALENNIIYICWASHSDDNPYHGWVCAFNISNVATTGITLQGVFCSSPNGGQAGIWNGGGKPSFETTGNTFYVETGNGDATGATVVNAAGFPVNGDYYEAAIKITVDTTTSPTNQNINGWGLKAVDYFIPSNQPALDNADQDLGSGNPLVLPASAGIPGHPDLMTVEGKQGVVYLIDRDNMGKFNPNHDNVLNAFDVGIATPPVAVSGDLSTPVFYNGTLYIVSGYSGPVEAFKIDSDGTLAETSQSANSSFGYLPGSPVLSSNGTTGGILWVSDRSSNELHAYDSNSLSTELWNTSQKANSADAPGSLDKMNAPTVSNGEVFLGTSNSLDIYGLTPPSTAVPNAPVLTSAAISATSINLSWTDSTTAPNTATTYSVEELISGVWTPVTTAPGGYISVAVGGLSLQTTYQFRIRGLNGIGYSAYSNATTVTTSNLAASVNFAFGFAGSNTLLTYNGSAKINGTTAELTDGGSLEASSVFSNTPVDITKFSTSFHFQLTAGSTADGFTFTVQSNSPTALGGPGGGLGYAGDGQLADPIITHSIAVKFDLYDNAGEGTNSTGLFQNGANPTVPAVDLTPSGINLHSGDLFATTLTYNGSILTETVTDTQTNAVFTQNYTVNIPADTGNTAYVGFTAGTGGVPTTQNVLDWTFSPNASAAPAAPSALGAVVASAASINLNWTNNATNQTAYSLDRATDALFTQNLVTQTLPAAPNSFTDTFTGLASGGTYYYRIRSINTAGSSVSSNVASSSIPFAPAKASNCTIESVTTASISLSWIDNAGVSATGYNILRAVNHGTFVLYTTLPNLNTAPPTEYDWTDTGLTPGVFYDYHIQCFNIAGYNDFVGGNATTLTVAPSALTGVSNSSGISLTWVAPAGATSFNVYRGTSPSGESVTPVATGVTATSYLDTTVAPSTAYYYYVTAVNPNLAPLNEESSGSNEVSIKSVAAAVGTSLNFSTGFASSSAQLTVNGGAAISGTSAQITNGSMNQATSVFSTQPLGVARFITSFQFNTSAGANIADGFTFCIQSNSPTAVGGAGGGLGYGSDGVVNAVVITNSIAVKFDLYSNFGEGSNSTGLYINGANPTVPSVDMTSAGINLHSGDLFQVTLAYDGVTLTETLTDTVTKAAFTQAYTVNIPASTGAAAYVGFTGGTGGSTTTTNILNWTFSSNPTLPPAAPATATNAVVASVTTSSASLTWNDNAGASATGYNVLRAVNRGTFSLYKTLPGLASPGTYSWTDTGLNAGTFYDYEIECYNLAGYNGFVEAAATTLTNAPTGLTAAAVGSGISLAWTAPVGAVTFNLYRGTIAGGEATIPIATGITTATYIDTTVVPSTQYYYYVTAVNGNMAPENALSAASNESNATSAAGSAIVKLTGTAIGVGGSFSAGSTYSAAFDGSFTTYFDPATGTLTNWVGLDLGTAQTITQIKFAARPGWEFRMYGGQFQASNSADFSSGVVTLYAVSTIPVSGQFTTVSVSPGGTYRYVRYTGGTQWVNIAEMEVDGVAGVAPTTVKLTGAAIGVGGNFSPGSTYAAAFDGSFTTYFDPADGTLSDWVGLDLTGPQTIMQIKFAPRSGYEFRMVGGQFQVSNSANFSSGVVTLYTISTVPVAGQFTVVNVNPGGAYRYIRYTGGTQWVNIAEMEVDGSQSTPPPTTVKLTGTAIGTGGAFVPASGYSAAFDGNFNTYYDPADGGLTDWVGLDLGAAETITQIQYAPRAGYEYRMFGGSFQVSNSANFSSGVATIYTVNAIPTAGQFTTVQVSVPGTYRYIRYTGGNQWVNIAEMEVDGLSM